LGPEFPAISRVRNEYIKHIMLKIPNGQSVINTKKAILKVKNSFMSVSDFRPIKIILNVDPY
jgi:primosomal protein N' (replication factor Y)